MFENQCNKSDTQRWVVRLMLFNDMVAQLLLHRVEVCSDTILLRPRNEIERIQKLFLHRKSGAKSSTSYLVMVLKIGAQPIEVLDMQRVYMYITKVKNMLDHRLPKQAWNIGCKLQKIIREIFSHLVRCLRLKWFNIWGVNDLLELTHHAMKYVITKDILLEALRMKWQDTKMSKMKYNIANANHQW